MSTIPTLELTFSDVAGSPWQGRAIARWQGEPSAPFAVNEGMSGKDRDALRWYVETYMDFPEGGNETKARAVEDAMRTSGTALWTGLKSEVVSAWLGAVQFARQGRLVLRGAKPADEIAFRTPWELMRAGQGDGSLLHQLGVTVVRRPTANLPRMHALDTTDGLRVLVVVCRPDDTGFLDPRYTPQAILDAIDAEPAISVAFCRPGTLAALTRELERGQQQQRPYHVVHFDGHGTTIPHEGGVGALCFEHDDGSLHLVRAPEFGDLMERFAIPLVVLEACRTATKTFAQETVASALLRHGVASVLAMGHSVHVDLTRILMESFYASLANGQPIGAALQAARNQAYASPSRRIGEGPDAERVDLQDWFVPQLYQGEDDPVLLNVRPRRKQKARPKPLFHGFPPAPRAGFHGRGLALHKLERAMLEKRRVVLHAHGGTGKTALAREAAAWWVRTGFFDGAIFVSFEGGPSAEAVIQQVGEALDGLDFHQRKDGATWLAEQLDQRRLLIVWDNYESVLPAFTGGRQTPAELRELAARWTRGNTRVLATCRDGETGLDGWPVPLEVLTNAEGLLLLVGVLERLGVGRPQRVNNGWTQDALLPIVERAGRHPLALELLAPQIPKVGPQAVADEMQELLATATQQHAEGRNRSMAASLDFSIRHLSPPTRAALPAVALLSGGCLENMAVHVAGVDASAWAAIREELERTGLVRVAGPALRPHPVLADAGGLAPDAALAERFVDVVLSFCAEFDELVRSEHAKAAMAALAMSEIVVRRAIRLAADAGNLRGAWGIADSLGRFLEMNGRSSEKHRLVTALGSRVGTDDGEIIEIAAALEQQTAMARAAAGDGDGAVAALLNLAERLTHVVSWDSRLQRARLLRNLGRVHYNTRSRPTDALDPLREAEALLAELEREGKTDSTNRSATLGDRANVLSRLGRYDDALATAKQGLQLDRDRGDAHAVARDLGRVAQIHQDSGRLGEAEAAYREALEAAEAAGDDELAGILWQSMGVLALDGNRPDEAVDALRKALAAFQRAGDEQGQTHAMNSLGNVERQHGHLEAAIAWYEKSLELAKRRNDVESQATARSNLAVAWTDQADRTDDPDERRRLLHLVIAEEREALALEQQLGIPRSLAISHSNLASSLRRVGELDDAEHHALQALAIREQIQDRGIWKTLAILEQIANARGDAKAAADYQRRKEEAGAEARQRAGAAGVPAQLVAQLLQLAVGARGHGVPLDHALSAAGAEDGFLATLAQAAPWLADHIRALADPRAKRPATAAPPEHAPLLDAAWSAAATIRAGSTSPPKQDDASAG